MDASSQPLSRYQLESKSVVASVPGAGFLAASIDEDQLVSGLVGLDSERLGDALEVTDAP